MKLVIVICHFRESLSWVNDLKHEYLIYNKNPNTTLRGDGFSKNLSGIMEMPNVGFDTMAYLSYIIDNYHQLPDYVCFSQDNPFYHCPRFLEKVNEFNFTVEFLPLGATYARDGGELTLTKTYAENVGIPYIEPIKFISSAQCIVSKRLIQLNPVSFYEKIRDTLSKTMVITKTNYYIEYLWPTILNFNNELILSRNNC